MNNISFVTEQSEFTNLWRCKAVVQEKCLYDSGYTFSSAKKAEKHTKETVSKDNFLENKPTRWCI